MNRIDINRISNRQIYAIIQSIIERRFHETQPPSRINNNRGTNAELNKSDGSTTGLTTITEHGGSIGDSRTLRRRRRRRAPSLRSPKRRGGAGGELNGRPAPAATWEVGGLERAWELGGGVWELGGGVWAAVFGGNDDRDARIDQND
jgi:hypothetical protein